MLYDRLKRRRRAVVHVGPAAGDLPQPRRLEGMLHLDDAGEELAAADVLARQADIVEAVVGEIPAAVAGRAFALGVEGEEATLGIFGDGLLVALDPLVERGAAGDHGAFVGRNRLG